MFHNLPHWLEVLLIGGDLLLGVLICGVLIGWVLKRRFKWEDEHPYWYERPPTDWSNDGPTS